MPDRSIYPIGELLRRWEQGTLEPEQAIGQILLHLYAMRMPPPQPKPFNATAKRRRMSEADDDALEF